MGKDVKAKEDHSAEQQVSLRLTGALYSALRQLGFPMDTWPSRAKLDELRACLQNFLGNRRRWESKYTSVDRVLRKHMAFTLLVPGGKADRARQAVNALDDLGYIERPPSPAVVAGVIRKHVRFHNVKAQRLVDTLKRGWPKLQAVIRQQSTEDDESRYRKINAWIQSNIKGLGQKATAHFMRNTGLWNVYFAFPLIDVHIHKALEAFHFKHSTYKEAEESFWTMAKLFGVDVILFDAVLWCAYANNWEFSNSDFDNYGYNNKQ